MGKGEEFIFQIQLISVLKEFLWRLIALVFPGLANTWMWEKKKKKSCRMGFMTQAKGNLWPSGKVSQLGWRQLSGKFVWMPESEISDLDPKFDPFIVLIHWALTITWKNFCFPIGCTRENYTSPLSVSFIFTQNTSFFMLLVTKCVGFPPYQSILWHQVVVLQFNSILTISTWM